MPRIKQDPRQKQERRKRRTGMFLSLFLSFLLILLTSAFVLHYVYQGASNVEITPDGVETIYRAAMGDTVFTPSEVTEEESEDEIIVEDDTDIIEDENSSGSDIENEQNSNGSDLENEENSNSSDQENTENSTRSNENDQNSRGSDENSTNSNGSE